MALEPIDEKTFVAYIDLSGFKEMMKTGKAVEAMDCFYNAGFHALREETSVNGLFVSDCGILFARSGTPTRRLASILRVVKAINRSLLSRGYMAACSVAWGPFSYQDRITFPGIAKQPIFGNGYLAAVMDCEVATPKIQPGQCRIVSKDLPEYAAIEQSPLLVKESAKHITYYWNLDHAHDIDTFRRDYRDSYNLRFSGMLKALGNSNRN